MRSFLPLIAALVLLTSCGEGFCRCPPVRVERLSAPHIQPITALDSVLLRAANGDYFNTQGRILGLASYVGNDGMEDVLAVVDGNLYAVPTANGRATLMRDISCPGAGLALAAPASRLACLGSPFMPQDIQGIYGCYAGCFSEQVQIASFSPRAQPQIQVEQHIADGHNLLSSPTWRPDGEALAVLDFANPPRDDSSSACNITLYVQTASASTSLVPALSMSVADFSLCLAVQVAWSPDGQTLAVLANDALLLLAAPSPATIAAAARTGRFPQRVLTPKLRVALQTPARAMVWAPGGRSVVVLSRDEVTFHDQITRYALHSSQAPTALFSPPGYTYIGPIVYSTAGRQLYFAYGLREAYTLLARQLPAADGTAQHTEPFNAWIPQAAARPQICSCPEPPTGLYAYMLPTTATA